MRPSKEYGSLKYREKKSVPFSEVERNLLDFDGDQGENGFVNEVIQQAEKYKGKKWELAYVEQSALINCLDPCEYDLCLDYAENTEQGIASMPPIVIIPGINGIYDIIDGLHRSKCAEMKGSMVLAYRPKS